MRRSLLVCALVLMLALPSLARADGNVTWIREYDPEANQFPEGIAIDKVGNIFVSMAQTGEVRKITRAGVETVIWTINAGLTGLAVDAPGNVYVGVFAGGVAPQVEGVWRIARDGGSATHLPGTEQIFLPNGLAFDQEGNLYVTSSYVLGSYPPAGAIWRVPRGGAAELWLQDVDLLGGLGAIPGYPPLGANGIAFRHNELFVASTEKGVIARVPVLPDGSAGEPSLVAESPELYVIDGIAMDAHGTIYAALVGQDRVVAVDPDDGSIVELAGPADGVDGPASLAFGTGTGDRQSLYFTNYAILHRQHPGVGKLEVGVPGLPLP